MELLKTQIIDGLNSNISIIERDEPFFKASFHSHPELELVYIKESYGKQVIGNTISHFEAGGTVFIGANLPHVLLNDEVFYKVLSTLRAKSIVVYFNREVFDNAFQNLVEANKIVDSLTLASYLTSAVDTSIDRLAPIYKHTKENFKEPVSLSFLVNISLRPTGILVKSQNV